MTFAVHRSCYTALRSRKTLRIRIATQVRNFLRRLGRQSTSAQQRPQQTDCATKEELEAGTIEMEQPFRRYEVCPLGFVRFCQIERDRIHAVASACRIWTIRKNVTEVGVTARADHFSSKASRTVIILGRNTLVADGPGEARPAGTRFILRLGAEQLVSATRTAVGPISLAVVVLAGEGPLRSLLPAHLVLLGSELRPPLGLALRHLFPARSFVVCVIHERSPSI